MRARFDLHSYPVRLVAGVLILILLTTLSAGLPAYWLAHTELQRQTWAHAVSAEQATASLLRAEQARLDSLIALLAERPTLHRLLAENRLDELPPYLRAFQTRSALDILILCPLPTAPPSQDALRVECPSQAAGGYTVYEGQPALLAARPITQSGAAPAVMVVAGHWLDTDFLRHLAAATGVEQRVLGPEGECLSSSLGEPGCAATPAGPRLPDDEGRRQIVIQGRRYFAVYAPLAGDAETAPLGVEVALDVDDLLATQARARAVLALSTGGVALLGALLGVWAVRRLTGPLEQLTRAAEAMAVNPPDANSPTSGAQPLPAVAGSREIRTLAAALQRSQTRMLAALDDLAQTNDWLNQLVQSIVEGVVTLDNEGRITFINERAAALVGVEAEAATGRAVDDLFAVADETGHRTSLHRLPLGGKQRVTLLAERADPPLAPAQPGQRVLRRLSRSAAAPAEANTVLEVTATRLRTPGGDEDQSALILRDITEEEALRHLRAYFLANITHEFRTPLSTLNASLELLMHEADLTPAEMRELLKPIHLSLLSLQTLIDNLLESSSIEAGRFVLRRQRVDLNQVIAAAIQVVQPLLERQRQTLAVSESPNLPPLMGDAARLTQVLVNLLGNASKYSPPGATVGLTVTQQGDRLRVAVSDRGPGLSPAERDQLFRRFVRLQAGTGDQYGIGLGLHVAKTTVEAHEGEVGVDDHPGGGSIFWFELPIAQGEQQEATA